MITDDSAAAWLGSALPQRILGLLDRPRTTAEVTEALRLTGTRVHYCLTALAEQELIMEADHGWTRTAAGDDAVGPPGPVGATTAVPGASPHDYPQAVADARLGMFGAQPILHSGEHAGRIAPERVAEFSERLQALAAEYFGPATIDWTEPVKYGFRWVLQPVDLAASSGHRSSDQVSDE